MKTQRYIHHHTAALSLLLSMAMAGSAVQADDMELYVTPPSPVAPNVLFVLDESGSMGWNTAGTAALLDTNTDQRMHQLQQAMQNVLTDSDNDNVNAAVMAYTTRTHPTRIVADFGLIQTNGTTMATAVGDPLVAGDGLNPSSGTPSVHALAAAVRWYTDGFSDDTTTAASPIGATAADDWCKPNYVVFMSDGQPNSNTYEIDLGAAPLAIPPVLPDLVLSTSPDTYKTTNCTNVGGITAGNGGGSSCSGEIASWGFGTDLKTGGEWDWDSTDITHNPADLRVQNITTHTVGMGPAADTDLTNDATDTTETTFMKYVSTQGGGEYFPATNAAALTNAFQKILDNAGTKVNYAYSAPDIPFDPSNVASSGTELYLPLIKPSAKEFWKGNIKKFELTFVPATGSVPDHFELTAIGNATVLNATTGDFNSVTDFWSSGGTDGGEPLNGGAASRFSGTRNLYTYMGGLNDELDHTDHALVQGNTSITTADLGAADANERDTLLYWTNWLDYDAAATPTTSARIGEMGAPIHTKPVIAGRKDLTKPVVDGDGKYLFITTSEGILHAFNTTSSPGTEEWAFMPNELLHTIKTAKANGGSTVPMYGLDGPITNYQTNKGTPSEKDYLVFGMRRGGTNYYALDITNPDDPKFAWEIIGGVASTDFVNLGQTWSKPIFTKMNTTNIALSGGSNDKEVLVFGGGYDATNEDPVATTRPAAITTGAAIYIVDAADGTLIKEITSTDINGTMGNGIVADLKLLDVNGNGIADRIYAADVGGRIIRIDIPDASMSPLSTVAIGTILADVGGGAGTDNYQRFFNTPAIALYRRGGANHLSIVIGSGHHPELLDTTTQDRLYMIQDPNIWSAPTAWPTTLTESNLYNATSNLVQQGDAAAITALNNASGWYIDLNQHATELVYRKAMVKDYTILFTTHSAVVRTSGSVNDDCYAEYNDSTSRVYALDLATAGAKFDTNGSGDEFDKDSTTPPDINDRSIDLDTNALPPDLTKVLPSNSDFTHIFAGLDNGLKFKNLLRPISWEEVIAD